MITDHGRPALEVRPYRPIDSPTAVPLEALRGSVLRKDRGYSVQIQIPPNSALG